ncbi:MAG: 1-deoxy-D-xylulose-5-phosphate synthase [Defluviitaleaceae bacterium]|nr:1-deoxy-D-xylulose-5-phosphate synthase [Defluviitaleaceae bacterium]
MRYLNKINSPNDLKNLRVPQMNALATEMRDFLVSSVSKTGGHLAPNLGVVDLAIALHFCFDSPTDKILWDVGHQCYPHKILTGRRDKFDTLRQFGGLSGFIKSCESPHDAFDVGHSSTSLSAAHGMAVARDLQGQNHHVAAVIGDGAITSGLALEGLNNIGQSKSNILVVLNDNQMSISENVGALSSYLGGLRTTQAYISAKRDVQSLLRNFPVVGKFAESFIGKTKTRLKYLMLTGVLFEELGFKYYGPIDGHNLGQMIDVLKSLQNVSGPVMLHVVTQKGKGYARAERRPAKFHGVEPFDIKTGAPLSAKKTTYTDVFSAKMSEIGQNNEKVVAITAAMPSGTGLEAFAKNFSNRFFDVGIAESHAVTFAAGLAKSGLRPVVAIYSTFMQRAYDQILHDICIQNLPVIFALDRAGAVAADGETHQGIFDLSFLAHMPNMTVLAPRSGDELAAMLDFALVQDGPVAIRYPKAEISAVYDDFISPIELGKGEILESGGEIAIVAVGSMIDTAHEVWEQLRAQNIDATLINARFVKPISRETLQDLSKFKHVFILEENVFRGGFGHSLNLPNVYTFAMPDAFPPQGTREEIFAWAKLDANSVFERILEVLSEKA